jgi:hypothetical protein
MAIEHKLKQVCESSGVAATVNTLNEAIAEKKVRPEEFSLRRMAEAFIGHNWGDVLQRNISKTVYESSEAVSASLFTAITGQLLVNEIKEKYQLASLIGDQLATTIPVTNGNLGTQKVPYLSDVRDLGEKLEEGEPYPQTSFAGQYITYPGIEKHGRICAVTMEAIFSDLTSQILDSARSVGTMLAVTREYKILQVVLGVVNNHSWNGNSLNTYLTSGSWVNTLGSFSLTDWTSMNTLEQLFVNMVDPVTGYPIMVEPKQVLVMPALRYTAKNILNATEVRQTAPGYATSGEPKQTVSANPLDQNYQILSSPHALKALVDSGVTAANANKRVYLGDFKKAFVWREAKPLTVVEAPANNPLEFNQDIALAIKAGWMGVAGVRDPRYVVLGKE